MKIELDLNDILSDPDYGTESLQDSVRRQVVAAITQKIQTGIKKQIDDEVARAITETIKVNLSLITPKLFEDLLNSEYTPVDRWGDYQRDKTTTFRKEIVKKINEEMIYKKTTYDSDKTPFTKAVDSTIEENMKDFRSSFNKLATETFTAQAMAYALEEVKKKLGIKI